MPQPAARAAAVSQAEAVVLQVEVAAQHYPLPPSYVPAELEDPRQNKAGEEEELPQSRRCCRPRALLQASLSVSLSVQVSPDLRMRQTTDEEGLQMLQAVDDMRREPVVAPGRRRSPPAPPRL